MAKKFLNRNVRKKKKKTRSISLTPILIIVGSAIMIVVMVILILQFNKRGNPVDAIIRIRDSVTVEMNGELPDKTTFFSELKNVEEKSISINYDNVNLTIPGEYEVIIKVYNKTYPSKLIVLDNEPPTLTLHPLTIIAGDKYNPSDFVENCFDNSTSGCYYEFYKHAKDSSGNPIDFGAYTNEGTYIIKLVAFDNTGNETIPAETTLTIIKNDDPNIACKFGNNEIDENSHLSINVTDGRCAINPKAYNDKDLLTPTSDLIENEKAKLSNSFSETNLKVKDVNIDAEIVPIFNKSNEGLVGYLINIQVYVIKNGQKEIILQYSINNDGSRTYTINKYNIK